MVDSRRTFLTAVAGALTVAGLNMVDTSTNMENTTTKTTTENDDGNSISGTNAHRLYDVTAPGYGAVGDGKTNDASAVQSAVDDATEANGKVFFPPGSYRLQEQIDVQDGNVALEGPPSLGAELKAGPKMSGSVIDGLTSNSKPAEASNVTVRCLELNGKEGWSNRGYSPGQKAIRTKLGENWLVENCYIHDTPVTGVGLDSVRNDRYINNVLERCGTLDKETGGNGLGIGVGEVKGRCPTFAFGNTILDTSQHAIILEQTGGFKNTTDAVILGNIIDGARGGIVGELADHVTCLGNTTQNTREYGIYFRPLDSNRGCRFVTMLGNVIRHHGSHKHNQDKGLLVPSETDYAWALGNIVADSQIEVAANINMMNSTGREAAGKNNKPTSQEWNPHFRGGFVENTDDGTLWHLNSEGKFKKVY